ncbi:hypothetical protein [Gluconobacter wancherniae]|uniref:hypothetical protein n=1 Tax=Gluconobacter wancherniae TaxID=1307955 RepID=UPI001B8D1246|nr:hypothetical protein [Gluconobacter wancherniae]MBS1095227.1 hypothetical protein [Gluconobacter wancherniae]
MGGTPDKRQRPVLHEADRGAGKQTGWAWAKGAQALQIRSEWAEAQEDLLALTGGQTRDLPPGILVRAGHTAQLDVSMLGVAAFENGPALAVGLNQAETLCGGWACEGHDGHRLLFPF